MKIAVFTYDFPHRKSCKGIEVMIEAGFKPSLIIAQEKKKLHHTPSNPLPGRNWTTHPRATASRHEIEYIQGDHNSENTIKILKKLKPHLGIILGARILSQETIDCFSSGILNIHPGLLPQNRGLDNIKWAIVDKIPQGVTAHLIDKHIDQGELITRKVLELENGFSMWEMIEAMHELEMATLPEALELIQWELFVMTPPTTWGENRGPVSKEIDDEFPELFQYYSQNYENEILKLYRDKS